MTYGEFLIPLSGGKDDAPILARAARLFAAHKVPTTLLYLEADPNDVMGWAADGMVVGLSSSLVENLKKSQQEVWKNVAAEAAKLPDFALERVVGLGEVTLSERASLADLIVVSSECARGGTLATNAFEAALMHERVPALILHEAEKYDFDHCVIAWNGSTQAARAMKAAMPFLCKAKKVTIIQIENGNDAAANVIFDPEKPEKLLCSHNIHAQIKFYPKISKNIGNDIMSYVKELRGDLLIAGAYGHSRAREFVFGGATKTFLHTENNLNLLISH